ncbi:HNH endonuclease [Candidatus Poriferisodalis sp.]|uniref:HNH endonuclease n=1 Tax=Candidatus Poriferisodalis sp. TaxID=3101277 RepID=UPI003B5286C9
MTGPDIHGDPEGAMPSGAEPASSPVASSTLSVSAPLNEPVLPEEPNGLVLSAESVVTVLGGARSAVTEASRVLLNDATSGTLTQIVEESARLRSAAQAVLLAATAALETKRAGSGRSALKDHARMSTRGAKRAAETSEQIARMPNVARGLAGGMLTAEHAEVLADAARNTSPEAIDTNIELLEAAAEVPPEVLRRDAREFTARHDPESVKKVLDRQRRDRSAAMFIDHSTGMGVLNAHLDPVSFALVRQAVENYCDALWHLDGGRDGTPTEIRNNAQRLADSFFEMLTDRNALATIGHSAANNADTEPGVQRPHEDAEPDPSGGAGRGPSGNTGPGRSSDTERGANDGDSPDSAAGRSIDRWRPSQAPNQLVIIADIGVIDGTDPDGLCEALGVGPVPPQILDDLSPETRISGAVFGGPGHVLWLGRSRRHASIAQQLAVAIRDRGCVLCRTPMHRCEFHHIDEWKADRGRTDENNLAALCDDCHNTLHLQDQCLVRRAAGRWDTEPRGDPAAHPAFSNCVATV